MKNEKKNVAVESTAQVNENVAVETTAKANVIADNAKAVIAPSIERLKVERTIYNDKKSGKTFFNYGVNGVLKGQQKKADFTGKDFGMGEVLDLVFDGTDTADLVYYEGEVEDKNGKVNKYMVYEAQTVDSDGVVWTAQIKPRFASDKSLITMLISQLEAKNAKATSLTKVVVPF